MNILKHIMLLYFKGSKNKKQLPRGNRSLQTQALISNSINGAYSERQVGLKSKRDDDGEGDEGVEWEEAPPAGNTNETFKVNDLNVQADASGDDDDID